ncbi:hypothetical protein [Gimesia chilikensis]|uniref:hypothetical protein n=1 Tax=Gimesia chilikensis TaxID=2605989 RepID=UPI003A95316A
MIEEIVQDVLSNPFFYELQGHQIESDQYGNLVYTMFEAQDFSTTDLERWQQEKKLTADQVKALKNLPQSSNI